MIDRGTPTADKPYAFNIFSIVFGIAYGTCFYFNYALFRYYPQVGEFRWFLGEPAQGSGPPIFWYGWIATAALVSALVALAVPRRWAGRLWHGWSWILPAAVILVILFYEKRWFI
jgi:hypothetical protein